MRNFFKLNKTVLLLYYFILPTYPKVSLTDFNYGGRGITSGFLRGSNDENVLTPKRRGILEVIAIFLPINDPPGFQRLRTTAVDNDIVFLLPTSGCNYFG